MADYRQHPDGRWAPAQSQPWAAGLDWEVATQPNGTYVACLYDRTRLVASITGRNRAWLTVRMWLRRRRYEAALT